MQWTQEQQPIIHSTADKLLVQALPVPAKPPHWWATPHNTPR